MNWLTSRELKRNLPNCGTLKPGLFISVGVPLDSQMQQRGPGTVQNRGGYQFISTAVITGREVGATGQPRYLKDMIREIHLKLVEDRIRHKVNLMFSGGIAMAEHVAKSLLCGADAVSIDIPLLIALECRLCYRCKEGKTCPVKLEEVEVKWGSQRMVNLLWRLA